MSQIIRMQSCGATFNDAIPATRVQGSFQKNGGRLQKPEKQKVCYEVVSPRNTRNCTCKDPPTRLQRHELNEDNKRNINLEQGKTRRI